MEQFSVRWDHWQPVGMMGRFPLVAHRPRSATARQADHARLYFQQQDGLIALPGFGRKRLGLGDRGVQKPGAPPLDAVTGHNQGMRRILDMRRQSL